MGKATGAIAYYEDGRYSVIHHHGVQQRDGVWILGRDLIELVQATSHCPECMVQRTAVRQLDAEMLVIDNGPYNKMWLRRVEESR